MAKIDDITKAKIMERAKVADMLEDCGVRLVRRSRMLLGYCPFHEDRNLGSFIVNERDNYYKCFSCGATGDATSALMKLKNLTFIEALRYEAAVYGIYIDDTPAPKVEKREPRQIPPEQQVMVWSTSIVKPTLHNWDKNPLLTYLLNQPLCDEDMHRLRNMIELYMVGTSTKPKFNGWSIWWQACYEPNQQGQMQLNIHRGKLMAYKPDGHRNKDIKPTWIHNLLSYLPPTDPNHFDSNTYKASGCLFGEHLAHIFKQAEICIVESEKSALICSAFTADPEKRIWMATGGKQALQPYILQRLIADHRYIVFYPDMDAYDTWEKFRKDIGYDRASVSYKPRDLWLPQDGDKADIADIMLRRQHDIEETTADIASRRLGLQETSQDLQHLIDKLDLHLID